MLLPDETRRDSAAELLKSSVFHDVLGWDDRDDRWPSDILVLFRASWPELDRSLRAIETVDREIRRCARAWEETHRRAEKKLDPALISIKGYESHLAAFPTPIHSSMGSLSLAGATTPGLQVAALPRLRVWTALASAPASALLYAFSAFGEEVSVRTHTQCSLDGLSYADDQMSVLAGVLDGDWRGSTPGTVHEWTLPKTKNRRYRAISESRDSESGHIIGGIEAVIWRTTEERQEDVVCARMTVRP